MRRITVVALALCALAWAAGAPAAGTTTPPAQSLAPASAPAKVSAQARCSAVTCKRRVARKSANEKWSSAVRAYGPGLLHARMECESGNHGGYALDTTGNGYWFAHQFDVGAWTGAGGRMRRGRPAGVWTMQPTKLEQDYRAVLWDRIHGGDAWPRCP